MSPPTIRELAVLPLLEDSLEDLGRALSIDEQTIHAINKKFSTAIKKQKEIFRAYLKTCLCPTWSDVINALAMIGKADIAEWVIETFELPQEFNLIATRKSSTDSNDGKSPNLSDSAKPLLQKSHILVSDDGAIPQAAPAKESQLSLVLDSVNGSSGRENNRRYASIRKDDTQSSSISSPMSPCSDDFQSAEETQLDTRKQTSSTSLNADGSRRNARMHVR